MDKTKNAQLKVQRIGDDILRIGLTGDWLASPGLPKFEAVEQGFAGAPVKAMEFETTNLGRWNSGLMTFYVGPLDV